MAERVLSIRVIGDSASGTKAINDVEGAANKVDPAAKSASNAIGGIESSLLNLVPGGQQAEGALTKMGAASEGAGISMKGALVGGAAAGALAIGALAAKGVEEFPKLTGEVTKVKNVMGGTSEEASKLVAVAHGMGVDVDQVSSAMFKMGNVLQATPQKFTDLGIAIAHNKDGTVDLVGTLANASEAYRNSTDATQKDAIAKAIGGKAGAALIPILKQGKEAIDDFATSAKKRGMIFSDKDLQQGAEYRQSMRELKEAGEGLALSMGRGLVPVIADVAGGAAGAVDELNSMTQAIGGLGGIMKGLTGSSIFEAPKLGVEAYHELSDAIGVSHRVQDDFGSHMPVIGKYFKDHTDVLKEQAKVEGEVQQAADETTKAEDQAAAAEQRRTKAIDALASAQAGAIDKDLAARDAVKTMTDSIVDYTDKTKVATTAVHDHGMKSEAAKLAQADLQVQTNKTAGDVVKFAEATTAAQEAQANANGITWDASQRNDALRGALEGVAAKLAPGAPLRVQLEGYIASLKSTPTNTTTVINADTAQAVSTVRQMERDFANSNPVVTVGVDLTEFNRAKATIGSFFANLGTQNVRVGATAGQVVNQGVR